MDADTLAVTERITAAINRSGLSTRAFASALGTSASRLSAYRHGKTAPTATFLIRAERIADGLANARDQHLPNALDAADALRATEKKGDDSRTLALILEARDRLRETLASRPDAAAAWEARPALQQQHWDVLFAALIGHEFEAAGRPAPAWTLGLKARTATVIESLRYDDAEVRAQTPEWLAARNIYATPRDLATV